ncbi:PDZ and LIM domain protein 2 [Amia ocellicauda]|uniref:PDZ and LIM domain protein 2 n=1 Tax=Amia ocellicauda TaxID=2972642 RepID=UPI0034645B5A
MSQTMNLIGPSPWGFRIAGGRDFKKAITVSKVNAGSKAEHAGLGLGDIIQEINGESTADMLNVEAQNKIKNSKTKLQLAVDRPDPPSPRQTNGISTPEQLTGRFQEVLQSSRDENQNYNDYSFSSPASLSPAPYSPEPLSPDRKRDVYSPTSTKSFRVRPWSPVEKPLVSRVSTRPLSQEIVQDVRRNSVSRTPTPPGRYSPHSPVDRELPISPHCSSEVAMQKFDRDSEVYKMIQENKESRAAPRQSNTFRMLQEVLEADEKEAAVRFPGNLAPIQPKPVSSVAGVQKYHTCEKCGTSIVTQAVRIVEDRYRHPECYTCTQCGLNLKMRGHFWFGDDMFCEKHAREKYHGSPGAQPTTVSPRH